MHPAHMEQPPDCIDVLNRMLALAMQTAEAANADKNHKLVLQAVREVTRLVTLINKITGTPEPKSKARAAQAVVQDAGIEPGEQKWVKSGKTRGKTGVWEKFFKSQKRDNASSRHTGAPLMVGDGRRQTGNRHGPEEPVTGAQAA